MGGFASVFTRVASPGRPAFFSRAASSLRASVNCVSGSLNKVSTSLSRLSLVLFAIGSTAFAGTLYFAARILLRGDRHKIVDSPKRTQKGCKESSRWSESAETTGNAVLIGSHPGGVPELLMQRSFTFTCTPDFRLWAQ